MLHNVQRILIEWDFCLRTHCLRAESMKSNFFQAIIVMIFDFCEILGEASVIYRVKCLPRAWFFHFLIIQNFSMF